MNYVFHAEYDKIRLEPERAPSFLIDPQYLLLIPIWELVKSYREEFKVL